MPIASNNSSDAEACRDIEFCNGENIVTLGLLSFEFFATDKHGESSSPV